MLKEKMSKIVWIFIIVCFAILVAVGQQKIKEQNEIPTDIEIRQLVQQNNEEEFIVNEEYKVSGPVIEVSEDGIKVSILDGNTKNIKMNEFKNSRTRDIMNVSQVSVGDYYKNGEIIRNISGEELRKELLLNLARAFNSSKLSTKTIRLKRLEKFEGYVNFKIRFYDGNYELFGKENPELFSIYLTADTNTLFYARTNFVSIYNLQKAVRDEVAVKEKNFYIELDESTLNNDRAYVKAIEIAE